MENNERLYKFIYPNSNDQLLKLSGSDLCRLFDLTNTSHLELRNRLGVDKSVTFGLEIESESANKSQIKKLITEMDIENVWCVGSDLSLNDGIEVKTGIMTDEEETWKDVKQVCLIMDKNSKIGNNAGGHVHIGSQILGDDTNAWINFIRFWGVYENIIFRFSSGEFLTHRPHEERYSKPIAKEFLSQYGNLNSKEKNLYFLLHKFRCQDNRDFAVNLKNVICYDPKTLKNKNTIEFRCPNGTLNPVIWQNNVNFFVKMLNYFKSSKYDSGTIDRRYRLIKKQDLSLKDYNEIYLDQMLELCDLVFDNNLDKLYFIKQYLKSFEVYNGKDDYIDTKRKIFTE